MPHPWEVGDHRQRWAGYLHPVYNLTLRTKLGEIQTPGELRAAEDDFVERRMATLRAHDLPGTYDLDGLKAIHRHMFQDVYEWAGDLRTVDMGRGTGPPFLPHDQLVEGLGIIANGLRDTDLLRTVPAERYPETLMVVYNQLNTAHPFREGNGRTQRAFVSALAEESGRSLDWTKVSGLVNDRASRLAREGNLDPLREVFSTVVQTAPGTRGGGSSVRRAADASFPSPPGRSTGPTHEAQPAPRPRPPGRGLDYGRD